MLVRLRDWENVHFESASKDVILLYHLCRLHTVAPSLRSVFTLSGYSRPNLSAPATHRENERASQGLPEYCAAVSIAWETLEASEAMQAEELLI